MSEQTKKIIRGRYKTLREISRGGMGVVFLAKDLLNNKDVAVKESFFSGAKQAEQAFELEAKLLARLEHPGLPKVLDYFFAENNVQTLVMDFIVGKTLEDVLNSGKFRVGRGLDWVIVTDWALQILDILRYLHNFEPPVVHRDIKPNNIKLTAEGKIILLDFGLAKGSAVTIVGGMSGYSPIEQVQRTGTDPRSDIYALGTTLFNLLTDQYPYTALDRFQEIYEQTLGTNIQNKEKSELKPDPQKAVGEINPQVPAGISEIVMQAMALMPNDRFQSVEKMKSEFLKARQTLDTSTSRQVIQNISGKTNIDVINYWEKAEPLFDDDEESIGHWKPQVIEQEEELSEIEQMNSFASFLPQKIENYEFENEPTEVEPDDLSATVSSTALFGKKAASQVTKPSLAINLSRAGFSDEPAISDEMPDFEKIAPSRKISNRKIPLVFGAGVLIFFASFGALAWYLIPSNSFRSNQTETKSAAEIAVLPKESIETANKPFKAAAYRIEKNGTKTLLNENYQFSANDQFKLGVTSPRDGFLYIVSRDDQAKAIFPFPRPDQKDNFIKKESEKIFPPDQNFTLNNETWVYFIVVPSRDDDLVRKISKILDHDREKNLSISEVKELFTDLDQLAADEAENNSNNHDSADQPLVKVVKLQKKT